MADFFAEEGAELVEDLLDVDREDRWECLRDAVGDCLSESLSSHSPPERRDRDLRSGLVECNIDRDLLTARNAFRCSFHRLQKYRVSFDH